MARLDGVIGHVKDFYFDDESWVIRYLVVQTGQWLLHRNVLISPIAINQPNWSETQFSGGHHARASEKQSEHRYR